MRTAAQLFDEEWSALVIIDVSLGLDLLRTFKHQRECQEHEKCS
jgi:hypothetical protein